MGFFLFLYKFYKSIEHFQREINPCCNLAAIWVLTMLYLYPIYTLSLFQLCFIPVLTWFQFSYNQVPMDWLHQTDPMDIPLIWPFYLFQCILKSTIYCCLQRLQYGVLPSNNPAAISAIFSSFPQHQMNPILMTYYRNRLLQRSSIIQTVPAVIHKIH